MKIRQGIFIFLFLVLSLPAMQGYFSFFESAGLTGDFYDAKNPDFTWQAWWNGTYQSAKSNYLHDSTGCRSDLVRFNNQLDYSLFGLAHGYGVVAGRGGMVYQEVYLDEFKGINAPLTPAAARLALLRVKKLQDTLSTLGKTFVFVFAPSKAWYYSNSLPERYRHLTPKYTDYQNFKQQCAVLGIHTIDFNGWFLAARDTTKELLFSKLGVHWTVYGAAHAADSLVKYIEKVGNIQMPEIQWTGVEHTHAARETDDDIGKLRNLIFQTPVENYAYPTYTWSTGPDKEKPKTIYVGDSFGWTWMHRGLIETAGTNSEYWFYFRQMWTTDALAGRASVVPVQDYDWKKSLKEADCIVMLLTPPNFQCINDTAFFVKKAYNFYYPGG